MIENQVIIEQPPEARVPWGARQAWWGVAALALWLGLAIGLGVLAVIYEFELSFSLVLAFGELSLLLPVWWLVLRKHESGWSLLGLRPSQENVVVLSCGALVVFYGINFCYAAFAASLGLEGGGSLSPVLVNPTLFWGLAFSAVLVAPFVEEIFFRGFLFTGFREKYGWRKAAALSALLFSLIHLQPLNMIPFFILGYIFAYTYEYSGSLWPAILLHATVNGVSMLLLGAFIVFAG